MRVHLQEDDEDLFYELGLQEQSAGAGTLAAAYPEALPADPQANPSDDDSEALRVTLDSATPAPDLALLGDTQSADAVNDAAVLMWIFKASNPRLFEVLTVKAVRIVGADTFCRFQARRGRFGTARLGDRDWKPLLALRNDDPKVRLRPVNKGPSGRLNAAAICRKTEPSRRKSVRKIRKPRPDFSPLGEEDRYPRRIDCKLQRRDGRGSSGVGGHCRHSPDPTRDHTMHNLDFSSWQSLLATLHGLVVITLVMVGIRLLVLQMVQQRRERENRQINERLRTLIAAYKTVGGSFSGDLAVDPTHLRENPHRQPGESSVVGEEGETVGNSVTSSDRSRRIRDAVEAALSDVILLGTEEQVRLAARAASELAAGRPAHTNELAVSLRNFIRQVLDLESVPKELEIPKQGPARPGAGTGGSKGKGSAPREGAGTKQGGGGAEGMAAGGGIGLGLSGGLALRPDHDPEER